MSVNAAVWLTNEDSSMTIIHIGGVYRGRRPGLMIWCRKSTKIVNVVGLFCFYSSTCANRDYYLRLDVRRTIDGTMQLPYPVHLRLATFEFIKFTITFLPWRIYQGEASQMELPWQKNDWHTNRFKEGKTRLRVAERWLTKYDSLYT